MRTEEELATEFKQNETPIKITKKLFFKLAENYEYAKDFCPSEKLISRLKVDRVDVLAFLERSWCVDWVSVDFPFPVKTCKDNVALADFTSYQDWLSNLKLETRARIKRSYKRGLRVEIVNPTWNFAKGVCEIYNETPIRQRRKFPHYGMTVEEANKQVSNSENVFIGAYIADKLVGFIELICGDNTGVISQILSLASYRALLPNNALIAKSVEICASKNLSWLVYGRIGNHPSLDGFKFNNGFRKCETRRFYVPLSSKGKIAMLLRLHRELKDSIPTFLKKMLLPLYYRFNGVWK